MAHLDINPEGEEGIISSEPQVPQSKSSIKLGSVTALAVGIVAIFAVMAFLIFSSNQVQKVRVKSMEEKISVADQQLASLKTVDDQAKAIYGQVKNLKSARDEVNLWSQVMGQISLTLVKSIKIDSLSLDQTGMVSMNGKARSLSALAKLITAIEGNDKFSAISVSDVGVQSGVITFTIKMDFSSTLLKSGA